MKKIKTVFFALLVILVVSTGPGWGAISGESELEEEMLSLVNKERVKAGLNPLVMEEKLVELARMKSQDMIDKNYFSHTSPTYGDPFVMMKNNGVNYRMAGENLAGNPSLPGAHESLMNSPGHRANILKPEFTHVGIGVVKGGNYGLMITQMFITAQDADLVNSEKTITKKQVTNENLKVILNNKEVIFPDIKPYINEQKRVMVPIRFVSEEMDFHVDWNANDKEILIKKPDKKMSLWIGKTKFKINEQLFLSDSAPQLHKSRTMVPLRLISEIMGSEVIWYPETREVKIVD